MDKKVILCFIGRSGCGKDTIVNKFLSQNERFNKLIPLTSRPRRDYEVDGIDYIFKSKSEMQQLISQNNLMEHRQYCVHTEEKNDVWYYGTPYPTSDYSVMINTLNMYCMLKWKYRNVIDIYPIYITLDEEELLYRAITRESKNSNPNYRELSRRFFADKSDYSNSKIADAMKLGNFDCVVENYDLDKAVNKINKYVKDTILI